MRRFWSKVAVGDVRSCWPWRGAMRGGYGLFRIGQRVFSAHRVAFAFSRGRRAPAGLVVMHACDNPPCCNPRHLRLGTKADNNRDRDAKGRQIAKPTHVITFRGRTMSLAQWAKSLGWPFETLRARHQRGWSPRRMLTIAPREGRNQWDQS